MRLFFSIAAGLILSAVCVGQDTHSTTINHSDGTQTTVTCTYGTVNTNCDVRDTSPEWHPLEIRKEVKAREAFCKSQGIPTSRMSAKKNQACLDAWEKHKQDEEIKAAHDAVANNAEAQRKAWCASVKPEEQHGSLWESNCKQDAK